MRVLSLPNLRESPSLIVKDYAEKRVTDSE